MKFVPVFVLVVLLIQMVLSRPVENEEMDSNLPISQTDQSKERSGLQIYAGGNAANLALAYRGSEAQAAENDQKSGYNNQNMGIGSEIEATEYEDDQTNE